MSQQEKTNKQHFLFFDIEHSPQIFLIVSFFLLSVTLAAIRSATWPMSHDTPVMHFIANQILDGKIPYQEIFDINLPGTYLIHIFVIAIFGKGDIAWRIFDLSMLFLIAGGMILFLWRYSKFAGFFSALMFVSFHLKNGAFDAGQRDFLMLFFIIYAFNFVLIDQRQDNSPRMFKHPLFYTGLLLGYATMIKPYTVILLFMFMFLIFITRRKNSSDTVRKLIVLVVGSSIAPILIIGWLLIIGAWDDFLDLIFNYLMPFYGHLAKLPYDLLFMELFIFPSVILLLGLLVMLVLVTKKKDNSLELPLVLLGLLYGFIHYYIQGKGWKYHQYPFSFFSFMLIGILLFLLLKKNTRYTLVGLAMTLFYAGIFLSTNSLIAFTLLWDGQPKKSIAPLTADILSFNLGEEDKVQMLDSTNGGLATLYRLGIEQPTRFIYDSVLLHDTDSDYIQGLQQEFLVGLQNDMPELIVIYKETGAEFQKLDRFDKFDAFNIFLAENYLLIIDRDLGLDIDSYLIYQKQ